MKVINIPCLQDNFSYLLICTKTNEAAVVDPAEMEPVHEAIKNAGVQLKAIFNTHHHWDHVGANEELNGLYPELKIYAHESEEGRIPGQTEFLKDNAVIQFGEQIGTAFFNPGHTTGDINYVFENDAFVGDTLFSGGCGRLIEGTAKQLYHSLNVKLKSLPAKTNLYFSHEYTEANLRFALSVEPGNQALHDRIKQVRKIRESGQFTTPTNLEIELASNPFLRCFSTEIHSNLATKLNGLDLSEESIFRTLRELKDSF